MMIKLSLWLEMSEMQVFPIFIDIFMLKLTGFNQTEPVANLSLSNVVTFKLVDVKD